MSIHINYALLLLGHVLGDFYFQNKEMADGKLKDTKLLLLHGVIYSACMAVLLGLAFQLSPELLWLWLFAGLTHYLIDSLKKYIRYKPFIIDQLLHFLLLAAAWFLWGRGLAPRAIAFWELSVFPGKPAALIILGLLFILRPLGLLIGSGEVWDFGKAKKAPDEAQKGAGKMIGYLERVIVLFLLMCSQFSAIAFVVAAKSVARFPEISKSEGASLAEYYLIGTLMSMVSVFAVALLFGLV